MRDYTYMGTQNSPSSSLWICTNQPSKLHGTERTVTKTNAIVKSAENNYFCNYSSFLLYWSFSKCKPFFSTELLFCSFSLVTSHATESLIFFFLTLQMLILSYSLRVKSQQHMCWLPSHIRQRRNKHYKKHPLDTTTGFELINHRKRLVPFNALFGRRDCSLIV